MPLLVEKSLKKDNLSIGLNTAIMLVIANMIGTGVFTTLGYQLMNLTHSWSILLVWLLGGLTALAGALSYAELSSAMPRSGGEYHLLTQLIHPLAGFIAGWISITVGFAAPVAASSIAVGAYFKSTLSALTLIEPQPWTEKGIALMIVGIVTLVHLTNLRSASQFQKIFTSLKLLLIATFILSGFALAESRGLSFELSREQFQPVFTLPFAIALVYVMYSYSGWNAAIYIADEIKQPQRNIPRALIGGTLIVTILYILLNALFLYSTPPSVLKGKEEVGYHVAKYVFGDEGGIFMGGLIGFGLISAISSMVWSGARVTRVMGEDIKIFSFLGKTSLGKVPRRALLIQACIIIIMIITSTFRDIVLYSGFILTLSSFVTVATLFRLRKKTGQNKTKHFQSPGYPFVQIFFLLITGWMMAFLIISEPVHGLAAAITLATALPLYWINQKWHS